MKKIYIVSGKNVGTMFALFRRFSFGKAPPVPLRLLFRKRQRFFGYVRPQTLSASSAPENVKAAAR